MTEEKGMQQNTGWFVVMLKGEYIARTFEEAARN
jgi:hypothetical protein